jgi:lincosamide nucleotidyltransferase A/C/D/E
MRAQDMLWILAALDAAEVPYWVAGGWGVDALVGRQTRKHDDLDLVLSDFERDEPRARRVLGSLGFRPVHARPAGIWMPMQSLMDDAAGHRIELLNIDEERLMAGIGRPPTGEGHAPADLGSIAFASGEIEGRTVACLSAEVQLLFHSGYELRSSDQRDMGMLQRALGTDPQARAASTVDL